MALLSNFNVTIDDQPIGVIPGDTPLSTVTSFYVNSVNTNSAQTVAIITGSVSFLNFGIIGLSTDSGYVVTIKKGATTIYKTIISYTGVIPLNFSNTFSAQALTILVERADAGSSSGLAISLNYIVT